MAGTLVLRADADERIGTGHVMRCLALAQAWRAVGGRAVFAVRRAPTALLVRLRDEGCEVERLDNAPSNDETGVVAGLARHAAAVVVDGYGFGPAYVDALQEAGARVLYVDDDGRHGPYRADLVLDQNAFATAAMYTDRAPATRLLLGPRYALLRREFLRHRDAPRAAEAIARRVLVTLGGADPTGVTATVLAAAERVDVPLELDVVVGVANPRRDAVIAQAERARHVTRVLTAVDDMPERMGLADFAVAAAGATTLELAFMGVPSLLVAIADNQAPVAPAMAAAGCAVDLGRAEALDPDGLAAAMTALASDVGRRQAMSDAGRRLVDGDGAARVVFHLRAPSLRLRPAGASDARLLWTWANDPSVRAVSWSQAPIPWDGHVAWLDRRLADPDTTLWIAEAGGAPVGTVRCDRKGATAVVSVTVAPEARGQGLGPLLVWLAARRYFEQTDVDAIDAYIKPDNVASVRAFGKAGYRPAGSTVLEGHDALHYVLARSDLP